MSVPQTVLTGLAVAVLVLHVVLALIGQRLARESEARHPPVGRFVDGLDGHRLHFRESGPREARAIVLVHGASANLLDMEASLRPPLEGAYRVVTVDRAGSGWSGPRAAAAGDPAEQADDVVRVLDALGIEEAIWVGHSWGGAVVLAALLGHPERVLAGVAISAPTHPWEEPLPTTIRLAAIPLIGHVLAACWVQPFGKRVLDGVLRDSFEPEPAPVPISTYRERTGAELALRPGSFRATAKDLVGLGSSLGRLAPGYRGIDRPLLLVAGSDDPLIPLARHAERVVAALPAAKLVRLPGAGHIVHHTHTERVVAEIRRFAELADDG